MDIALLPVTGSEKSYQVRRNFKNIGRKNREFVFSLFLHFAFVSMQTSMIFFAIWRDYF